MSTQDVVDEPVPTRAEWDAMPPALQHALLDAEVARTAALNARIEVLKLKRAMYLIQLTRSRPAVGKTAGAPRRTNGASGRPAARRTASRSASGGSDGDDGPAEPEPPRRRLTLAPRRGIYTYGLDGYREAVRS